MGERQLAFFPDPTEVRTTPYRHDHPSTSRLAAIRSAPGAATQRGRLLVFLHDAGDDGLTAFEAEELMLIYFPRMRTVRPRLVELRDQGWVLIEEGRTRLTDSGSRAQVNIFNPAAEGDYVRWHSTPRSVVDALTVLELTNAGGHRIGRLLTEPNGRQRLTLEIVGVPAPQGSKRAFIAGGRAVVTDGSSGTEAYKRHKSWRADVRDVAVDAGHHFIGKVEVRVRFTMPRPKSRKREGIRHGVKPDIDKLLRSVLDSLTEAGTIEDDARVWRVIAEKFYVLEGDPTGAHIEIVGTLP